MRTADVTSFTTAFLQFRGGFKMLYSVLYPEEKYENCLLAGFPKRACSSGDRATVSGAVCRRFESCQARFFLTGLYLP